jgi:hypothetical protein
MVELPIWVVMMWGPLHVFLGVLVYKAGRASNRTDVDTLIPSHWSEPTWTVKGSPGDYRNTSAPTSAPVRPYETGDDPHRPMTTMGESDDRRGTDA